MKNNKKGSILPVTVVAMMIMTIIGLISLQMFMAQNILDTIDQAKIRTQYSAEGAIEMARGYIDYITREKLSPLYGDNHNSGNGYLYSKTASRWYPLNDFKNIGSSDHFDGTMHPIVDASVYCERMSAVQASSYAVTHYATPTSSFSYVLVATASAVVSNQRITSTVTYCFYTTRHVTGSLIAFQKHFLGWRKS